MRLRAAGPAVVTDLANSSAEAAGQAPAPRPQNVDGLYPIEISAEPYLEPAVAGYQLAKPRPRQLAAANLVAFFRVPQKREMRQPFTGAHGIVGELPMNADLIGGQRTPQLVARRTFRRQPTAGWDYGTEYGTEAP